MFKNCECLPSDAKEACPRRIECGQCNLLQGKIKSKFGDEAKPTPLGARLVRINIGNKIWVFKDGKFRKER